MTSLEKVAIGNKAKIVFLVNRVFGQKFTTNAKICCIVSKFVYSIRAKCIIILKLKSLMVAIIFVYPLFFRALKELVK